MGTGFAGGFEAGGGVGSTVDLTTEVTGTLPVANGGTGATSLTDARLLVGNGTSAIGVLGAGTNNQLLIGQTGSDPIWTTNVDLPGTLDVTGAAVFDSTVRIGSATPQLNFEDTDCTDTDVNAQVLVAATDTGSGTEDADVTFLQQIAGTLTAFLTADADGNITFGSARPLVASGGGSLTGTWSDLGTVTTVDINGGTVDGATIGGTSAGAGTFTTLTVNTSADINGAIDSDVAGVTSTWTNTSDAASVQVAIFEGDRATMGDNDEAYVTMRLSDDGGTQTEVARLTWVATDVNAGTSVDGRIDFAVMTAGALADEMQLDGTALAPSTDDGLALGIQSTNEWADLFLAGGGVLGWDNNQSTFTHNAAQGGVAWSNSNGTILLNNSVGIQMTWGTAGQVTIDSNGIRLLSSAASYTGTITLVASSNNIVFGNADAQTTARTGGFLRSPNVATGGAGNVAGADFTFASGVGTGTGTRGTIIFQTPTVAAAGDNLQALATRLTLAESLATFTTSVLVPLENDATTPTLAFGDGDSGFYESADDILTVAIAGAAESAWSTTAFYPTTDDGLSLGIQSTNEWSDLHLASGAVIGFDNADVTITHGANTLTMAGGSLGIGGAPSTLLHLTGIAGEQELRLTDSTNTVDARIYNSDGLALINEQAKNMTFQTNATVRLTIGSAGDFALGNDVFLRRDVNAGLTASTTQTQGNGVLTADINEISTCANVNDTVTLPTASAGRYCLVINNGAQTAQVFPASGDNLGAGVDTATTITAGSRKLFIAFDSTNWEPVI